MIGPMLTARDRPDWSVEGRDWPHRSHSRFVRAGGLHWHVQVMGSGPVLLLIHGTGASSHSWRDLAPLLAERFTLVVPDLPGHGFTPAPNFNALTLPFMARRLGSLMQALARPPGLVVGHSAGAAIGLRMALDGLVTPDRLIGLNAALRPFEGASGVLFPAIAKLLFLNPLAPRLFAASAADPERVQRLIDGTGSTLDAVGSELYRRLFRKPAHVAGTLGMMAAWKLEPLLRDLPGLTVPVTFIVGDGDRTVPPRQSEAVAATVPGAGVVRLAGLGHLAHEEAPDRVAVAIVQAATGGEGRDAA